MTTTALTIILLILTHLLVPRPEIRRLSSYALVSGPLPGLAIFTLAGPVLRLWWFHDRAILLGLPFMLILAWYPTEILFAYAFRILSRWYQRIALVIVTALGSLLTFTYLSATGVWRTSFPQTTNGVMIFLLATVIHTVLAIYLWLHREEPRRSSIPPLR